METTSRAREYWDAADMARQFDKSNFLVKALTFLSKLPARREKEYQFFHRRCSAAK
jgi:hypothetical protein